jgi:2'-5' RNA ligase
MSETEKSRLFVAIFPSADIVTNLQTIIACLAKHIPAPAIRWTPPEQIHLTLHFLGSIASTRIPEIESALASACDGHRRCAVRVSGLGCFPNPARPRVVWAGLAGDLAAMETLKNSIDAALLTCGGKREERAFHPHLTLGRVSQLNVMERKRMAEVLAGEQGGDFAGWQVDRVDLMQSVLSPQGATYRRLKSVALDIL